MESDRVVSATKFQKSERTKEGQTQNICTHTHEGKGIKIYAHISINQPTYKHTHLCIFT